VSQTYQSIYQLAYAVLTEPDPKRKAALSGQSFALPFDTKNFGFRPPPPGRPARPDQPVLLPPQDMPKRSTGEKGRIALLHALAHIELNAIDLAWDIILRFGPSLDESDFIENWCNVANEEAHHFLILCKRLNQLGASYGDLPAHDGLWEAAEKTSDNLMGRLAIIPMFLEARGVDTSPKVIQRLKSSGDKESAKVLEVIFQDEIKHLGVGVHWFEMLSDRKGVDPVATWKSLVTKHLNTKPKLPINEQARRKAGMSSAYWETWPES